MKLTELQNFGSLPVSLKEVSPGSANLVSVETALSAGRHGTLPRGSIVVTNDVKWIATVRGRPSAEAASVYSSNEFGDIGCWKREDGVFLLMRLIKDRLVTVKELKFKEDGNMPGINTETESMNAFDDFEKDLAQFQEPQTSDTTESGKDDKKKPSQKKLKDAETQRKIDSIRSKTASVQLADNMEIVLNNQRYGRLLYFITATNDSVKVSTATRVQLDADGKAIPDTTKVEEARREKAETVAKWEKENKYPKSVCIKEKYLRLSNAKPGKTLGAVIRTPVSSEINLTDLVGNQSIKLDSSKSDMKIRIIPMEGVYSYLGSNYNGEIKEDEEIMGAMANTLAMRVVEVQKKEDPKTGETPSTTWRTKLVVKDASKTRKAGSVITSLNYVPIKVYKTAPIDSASKDQKALFNNNVAALFKKRGDTALEVTDLDAESQQLITFGKDGMCKCAWFENGKIPSIIRFDGATEHDVMAAVNVPLRECVPGKTDPTSKQYRYQYIDLGAEGGPQDLPEFQRLIKLLPGGINELLTAVNGVLKRSNSGRGGSNSRPTLSNEDYLKNILGNTGIFETGSYQDIASMLDGVING